MGFALFTREVVLNPENPSAKLDAELLLASRQQQTETANIAATAAGRGLQSLSADPTLFASTGDADRAAARNANNGEQNSGDLASLPLNGAGLNAPTESVSITGAQGRTQDFGNGSEEDIQGRIQEFRERMQANGGPGGFGEGFCGGPGGGGGGGWSGRIGGGGPHIKHTPPALSPFHTNPPPPATP